MSTTKEYRILKIAGSPYERGVQYGQMSGDSLRTMLEVELFEAMEREKKIDRDEIFRFAEGCLPFIEKETPRTFDFLKGCSASSGLEIVWLTAILCHEEFFHGHTVAHHCTCYGASSRETLDGNNYIAQTWDWLTSLNDAKYLLRQTTQSGNRILSYAFPGLWTGAGMSSAGVALVWAAAGYGHSGLHGAKAQYGVPSYALISEALEEPDLDSAVSFIMNAKHAGWFLFLMGGKDGRICRIEATPEKKAYVPANGLAVCHGVYLDNEVAASGMQKPWVDEHNQRHARMSEMMVAASSRITPELMVRFSQDQVEGNWDATVCLPLTPPVGTLDGFVLSPSSGKAWFIQGPPNEHKAQQFTV